MKTKLRFNDLIALLHQGREIEFRNHGKAYSITNAGGQ